MTPPNCRAPEVVDGAEDNKVSWGFRLSMRERRTDARQVRPADFRRHLRWATGGVIVLLSPFAFLCGDAASAQGAVRLAASTSTPTWAAYFYPTKIGLTCTDTVKSSVETGSETFAISSVTKTSKGQNVDVAVSGSVQAQGDTASEDSTLHYVLTKSGGLTTTLSNALAEGRGAPTLGQATLPTPKALLAGAHSVSKLSESEPLTPSQLAEMASGLEPHQKTLNVTASLFETGTRVSTLTVPMGTFHNVLEVHSKVDTFEVTNALAKTRGGLDSALLPEVKRELSFATWYAPGVGPVQIIEAGVTIDATGCTG